MQSINLIDVDLLVENFIKEREQGIATLHRVYFHNDNQLSLRALKEDVIDELRTGCVSFINKGSPIEELHNYLFYITNAFCKKLGNPYIVKQKIEYICPGCLFLGKECPYINFDKIFKCDECKYELSISSDPKKSFFFETFACHNRSGFRCFDCDRFIPQPMNNSHNVSCPYFDCCFSGSVFNLKKMHHPTSKLNTEKLILDIVQDGGNSLKDKILSQEVSAHSRIEIAEDLQDKVKLLNDIIETQSNNVIYSSSDATVRHKQYVYKAFSNLLKEFPIEMSSYLLNNNDNHMGFQHRIFQEYIKLLEESFPFIITKNKKRYKIDNLLDNNLCLFDGISEFDGVITDKLIIKNGTKEFYIGGRKAAYTKPFYIGKLLNIIKSDTKISIMDLVKDYSFSQIRMYDIVPNTPVIVTHLRVPPHYQMGGMVYVNRIRKKIVERAKMVNDNV
jgi:hypothetical protein